jgi:hypothetical protein
VQVPALTIAASPAPSSSVVTVSYSSFVFGLEYGCKDRDYSWNSTRCTPCCCSRNLFLLRAEASSCGTKYIVRRHETRPIFLPKMEEQDREHAARKLFAGGQWRAEADAGQKVGGLQDAPNHTSAAPVELKARRPMKW